jgi:hypothetical protein
MKPTACAVHREDAVCRDEFVARAFFVRFTELRFEVGEVVVFVAVARRLAEADAVYDRGVVQFIGDHGIFRAEECFKKPAVRVEARAVEDRVLRPEESAQRRFELFVDALRAADESHAREPVTPAIQRRVRRGSHVGMLREAEVIVRAEIQHFAPVRERDARALRRPDEPLALPRPRRADGIELRREMV